MKIANLIFIFLFVVAAVLQYNDPDPYIWIPIYLYGAFLCYQAYRKRYNPALFIAGLCIYLGYAAYLFFDDEGVLTWARDHDAENIAQSMKATKPYIEETREFGGLAVLALAVVANMIWLRRHRGTERVQE